MKSIYLARKLAKMAWAKKAEEILILDVREVQDTWDMIVICTGSVGLHVRAITEFVVDEARKLGERPFVQEKDSDEWMAIDFVDVAFHCFQPRKRDYYDLEHNWADALFMPVDDRTGTALSLKEARETMERRQRRRKEKA